MQQFARKLSKSCTQVNFRTFATVPPPRLFDYETVTSTLKPTVEMVEAIENCFGKCLKGLRACSRLARSASLFLRP